MVASVMDVRMCEAKFTLTNQSHSLCAHLENKMVDLEQEHSLNALVFIMLYPYVREVNLDDPFHL